MRRAIFPATFDPIHYGHIDIAVRASKLFDDLIIGVYDRPAKNIVFGVEDRVRLVKTALKDYTTIKVVPYTGMTVAFARNMNAQTIVRGLRVFSDFELEFRMALANSRLAPDIDTICLIASEQHMHLASSTIREISSLGGDVSSMVPAFVEQALLAHFKDLGDDAPGSVDMVSFRD
nr:pantetheine-phosphate adenylyltransferase [Anaerolineae bacterium]